jgi:hypothetical protein
MQPLSGNATDKYLTPFQHQLQSRDRMCKLPLQLASFSESVKEAEQPIGSVLVTSMATVSPSSTDVQVLSI